MLGLRWSNNFAVMVAMCAAALATLALPMCAQRGGERDRIPTEAAPRATRKSGPPPPRAVAVLEWVPQQKPVAAAGAKPSASGPTLTVSDPDAVARQVGASAEATNQPPTKDNPPAQARLVPVAVFWQGEYQDAGVFLAHPVPLALEADTVYQLEVAGNPAGTFTLHAPTHAQDAWLGVGTFKPVPPPMPFKPNVHIALGPQADDEANSDRPVLRRRHAEPDSEAKPAANNSAGGDDPDRPTLHRRDSSASAPTNAGQAEAAPVGSDDPDRPTLHRAATPAPATPAAAAPATAAATAATTHSAADLKTSDNYLNPADDRNRPHLKPGIYQQKDAALPGLLGSVGDVRQTVAVSDAAHDDEHDFAHAWLNPAEKDRARQAMQQLAQQQIAAWKRTQPATAMPSGGPSKTAKGRKATATVDKPDLADVQFAGYDLAYQDEPTYVFAAQTSDTGPSQIFVCVVARPDIYGNLQVPFSAVTSGAQLALVPRYRLVDAVDADGDGRADLLLEARNLDGRRFVLLNLYRGVATKAFETGLVP